MTTTEPPELTESTTDTATETTADKTNKTGKLDQVKTWFADELKHRPRPMTEQIPTGRDLIEYSRSGPWTLDPEDSRRRKAHTAYSKYFAIPVMCFCITTAHIVLHPERLGAALLALALIGGGIGLYIAF